jgi:hypothetical protein
MKSRLNLLALALAAALPGMSHAAGQIPDGSTPEQKALIAGDPPFHPSKLVLEDVPAGAAKPQVLFNGRNLDGWDSWLGYKDFRHTYAPSSDQPIGLNHDTTHVFSVVTEDGAPVLMASGKIWGGLITKQSYGNYHLHLQFKWGKNNWVPERPRNNGVLYHSHGQYGAFFGTWMQAIEFEIVPHSVGMLLAVGDSHGTHSFATVDWNVNAQVEVGQDKSIPYPYRRFMPGGKLVPVQVPAFNVEAASDAEKPFGQWNTLDLYVHGDESVHVVNGVPVMMAHHLSTTDGPGKPVKPLTEGRIQLQSEGAETYFRNITIEPIDHLPKIHAE